MTRRQNMPCVPRNVGSGDCSAVVTDWDVLEHDKAHYINGNFAGYIPRDNPHHFTVRLTLKDVSPEFLHRLAVFLADPGASRP